MFQEFIFVLTGSIDIIAELVSPEVFKIATTLNPNVNFHSCSLLSSLEREYLCNESCSLQSSHDSSSLLGAHIRIPSIFVILHIPAMCSKNREGQVAGSLL